MLRLRTLGELTLEGSDGDLLPGRRKELVLLVYLAQRAPGAIRRSELVALLWEDREERRARHSLRQALLTLRRATGERLRVTPDTVALESGVVELDVVAFQEAVTAGRLDEAVGTWGGDFLEGLDDLSGQTFRFWVEAERERARRRLAGALERLVDEADAAGDRGAVAAWAQRWTELLPFDERAVRRFVEECEREGRLETACRAYAAFTARLRRELDVEPSTDLVQLGERLDRAATTGAASDAPRRARSAAVFSPDLVGREAARSELLDGWRAVQTGGGAVIVVEAEEGMGKTLLCEEFLRSIADRPEPSLVLRARAREEARETPGGVARELFAGAVEAPALTCASNADLAELSRLVPGIRLRWPQLPEASGSEALPRAAAVRTLAALAQELSVVVFVDDLHQADRESADLITALARQCPSGLLILATLGADGSPEARVEADLRQTPGVRFLKLPPLDPDEIETMLGSMLALSTRECRALAARLHRDTGGNPLYASEVVSAMVDEGYLVTDRRGVWRLDKVLENHPLPVPPTVREAVGRRLAQLGEAARDVVRAGSTLPEPIHPTELAEATGLGPQALQEALYELLAARLLRHGPDRPDAFEFVHPIIRRVALERLPTEQEAAAPSVSNARRRSLAMAGVVAAALVIGFGLFRALGTTASTPTLAVGHIEYRTSPDSADPGPPVRDMLATSLARVPGLQVISSVRMYEMLGHLDASPDLRASFEAAALGAGADELLEGSLTAAPDRGLRLRLWRVDLSTGRRQDPLTVNGSGPFEVAERAAARVASAMGTVPTDEPLTDVTTASVSAYRLYEEGLRSYGEGAYDDALRLFAEALAEDSLFAMAALYARQSAGAIGRSSPVSMERLEALAARAPDRERLLIQAAVADYMNEPRFGTLAETLSIRYPAEPEGHLMLGRARFHEGDFLGALTPLSRVIALDSLGLHRTGNACKACVAFATMASAYRAADSVEAAERVARKWMRLQPTSPEPWRYVGTALAAQGRLEEATAAFRTASAASRPDEPRAQFLPRVVRIQSGDYPTIDALLVNLVRSGTTEQKHEALWYLTISLRHQGRLNEAHETARRLEASMAGKEPLERLPSIQLRAQVLFELGRFPEAAHVFDSLATFPPGTLVRGQLARHKSWNLIHLATSAAAASDTALLQSLLDPLVNWGARSGYGRDRRLHHHARALLLVARGELEEAVAELRRAIYSPTLGYTRTNYELAQTLLTLDRPDEAVATLRSALRGALDGPNLYVTRTELHELLGRAHFEAGSPDSATAHFERVLEAWRDSDPSFASRLDEVRAALAALRAASD